MTSLEKAAIRRQSRREWLDEQKSHPCSRCEREFPPVAMDFHHRDRETKEFEINTQTLSKSLESLATEIEKCDLLCAVCHRLVEAGL